jgi:NADP-reducing hydrogenase subunit HndB
MKSLEELKAIRDKARENMGLREDKPDATRVVVGMAPCGSAAGARPVMTAFLEEVAKERPGNDKLNDVIVGQTGCIGICQYEPVVEIIEQGRGKTTYINMTPEKAVKVVHRHLIAGEPVVEYTIGTAGK